MRRNYRNLIITVMNNLFGIESYQKESISFQFISCSDQRFYFSFSRFRRTYVGTDLNKHCVAFIALNTKSISELSSL